jgi:uncharacterized protein YndB with AHSA1/START domain
MRTNSTPQAIPAEGTVDEIDGRYVLRFERRFEHPVERVWDALTRPERITQWFGEGEVELELVEGGRYQIRTTGPPDLIEAIIAETGSDNMVQRDTVLRVEPPLVFEHTFEGDTDSVVRWELQPDGDGCRLFLTHTVPAGRAVADAAGYLSGWHMCLELLGHALDGAPVPWRKSRWEEHRDRYAAKSSPV